MTWLRGLLRWVFARGPAAAGQKAAPCIAGGWRRGRPLIPANAVGFFALLTVAFGVVSGLYWYGARSWDEQTAIVDGSVVAVHVPSVIAKGPNKVDIRYTVDGVQHTIRIDADPGDHFLRMGDTTPVEYATTDPDHARAVWAVEGNRSDGIGFGIAAAVSAVLTAAVGIAYLLGPRQRGRH